VSARRGSAPDESGVRLDKFIAGCGVVSRREARAVIAAGRVTVDGKRVDEPGLRIRPQHQRVQLDGQNLRPSRHLYLLFNKPPGCVTTLRDPRGRRTVLDYLPPDFPRVFPVGRLDYDTEGLLLLTNDGDLAHRLTHPSREVRRIYRAVVEGRPSRKIFAQLKSGVRLADGWASAEAGIAADDDGDPDRAVLRLVLREGRNREVRRMLAAVGHPVVSLRRVRFGPLSLGELEPGRSRALEQHEIKALREMVGMG